MTRFPPFRSFIYAPRFFSEYIVPDCLKEPMALWLQRFLLPLKVARALCSGSLYLGTSAENLVMEVAF
jgi:hypothetical protein